MWPDKLNTKDGTIYMEIGNIKVKLSQKASVRLKMNKKNKRKSKFRLTSWRDKIWTVWERDTWYKWLRHFCNRDAAIMWLKRYGKPGTVYMLENRTCFGTSVRVENGYVYFYSAENGLMISAESKRTCNYAVRNN